MSAGACRVVLDPSYSRLLGASQVYYIAKQCSERCTPEEYAIKLAAHFVKTYPKASKSVDRLESAGEVRQGSL